MPDLAALIADPRRVTEIPPEAVVTVLGELERLRVSLWAQLLRSPAADRSDRTADGEGDRLLTIPAVAELLAVPVGYAYELARRGELPTVPVGKRYVRVPLSALRDRVARVQGALGGSKIGQYSASNVWRQAPSVPATTRPRAPDQPSRLRAHRTGSRTMDGAGHVREPRADEARSKPGETRTDDKQPGEGHGRGEHSET